MPPITQARRLIAHGARTVATARSGQNAQFQAKLGLDWVSYELTAIERDIAPYMLKIDP